MSALGASWAVLGEEWGAVALRTPTLPPATHTNTHVLGRAALTLIDPASPYPEAQGALEPKWRSYCCSVCVHCLFGELVA